SPSGNAVLTKLSANGSQLVYSTFLGGSGSFEQALGVAIDPKGDAFVTGHANSTDFPRLNALQSYQGNQDAFIAKFGPGGTTVAYSTYLGGTSSDEGFGVAV